MSELAAFLKAIRSYPDDDLPRLIFADWLEERGDPRGEFIRLQCGRSMDSPPSNRERELEYQLGDKWLGPLVDHFSRWRFHRGFVEPFIDPDTFLATADELLDSTALVSVHLQPVSAIHQETLAALASSPVSNVVRSLFLCYEWIGDEGVNLLAGSPNLGHVVSLDLHTNGLTDAAAIALAETPNLPALRHLVLANNSLTDAAAIAFAQASKRSNLEYLGLATNEITPIGALALAESPCLGKLSILSLEGNRIDGRSRGGRAIRRRFGR